VLSRPGASPSVPDIVAAIDAYLRVQNHDPEPFIWTATAEESLENVRRGRMPLTESRINNESTGCAPQALNQPQSVAEGGEPGTRAARCELFVGMG
jgi:hypothetical protein